MSGLAFEEFKKAELRIAKIVDVQEIPGADRLWKLLGVESKGMLLGAKSETQFALLVPDKDLPPGSLVG